MASRLLCFNKPYGVLSQFTPEGRWRGLKDYIDIPGIYVAGAWGMPYSGTPIRFDDLVVADVGK